MYSFIYLRYIFSWRLLKKKYRAISILRVKYPYILNSKFMQHHEKYSVYNLLLAHSFYFWGVGVGVELHGGHSANNVSNLNILFFLEDGTKYSMWLWSHTHTKKKSAFRILFARDLVYTELIYCFMVVHFVSGSQDFHAVDGVPESGRTDHQTHFPPPQARRAFFKLRKSFSHNFFFPSKFHLYSMRAPLYDILCLNITHIYRSLNFNQS